MEGGPITGGRSGTSFTLAKLREIYLLICRRFNLPAIDADTVCREIESHTGIIIKATYDTYEFSHKSIQEYLVAEHLVRLRDIPSAIRLLRDCPNELAVAVALSSDPTDFFCGLFRYKGTRVKPKKNEWLIVFLSRLADEKPGLEDNPELGGTCLWLFSRCQEVVLDSRIQPLMNLNPVQAAIRAFLVYTDVKISNHVSVQVRGNFDAKYPLVTRFEFRKDVAERIPGLRERTSHNVAVTRPIFCTNRSESSHRSLGL